MGEGNDRATSGRRRGGRKARLAAHVPRAAPGGRRARSGNRADGAGEGGQGEVLVIACGALAREIRDLVRLNDWRHVRLLCLPADLHLTPEKIPEAVAATVEANRDHFSRILVAYGDCGTGGALGARMDELGVGMLPGAHCYAFFTGIDEFAGRDEPGAFYLTDFLVRQFDAFVWKPLGLDRHPELRDSYFAHYDKLVYLAQSEDEALTKAAQEAAGRLGLGFERRFTGYGDLARALTAAAEDAAAGRAAATETEGRGEGPDSDKVARKPG